MIEKFPEGSLLPFQSLFRKEKFRTLVKKLSRAFKSGLASLVLGGCAGSVPGLHVSAGYDGEARPTVQSLAVWTQTPSGHVPDELIPGLSQK
jgi:hypothetical protein